MMRPSLGWVRVVVALLTVVLVFAMGALARTDIDALPVGAVFLALVVAGRLSGLYRYADVGAAAIGIASYVVLEQGRGNDGAVAWAAASSALVAAVVAARLVERRIRTDEALMRQTEQAIDELTLYAESSGLLKRRYGELAIEEEVRRARRTNTALTLILLAADPAADHPLEALPDEEEEAIVIGTLLRDTLRLTDRTARMTGTLFAAILPATGAEGGTVVAEKLREVGADRGSRPLRCGVAAFPDHAVSAQDLLEEAEAALRLARTAGLPVVTPTMLRTLKAM
jgi:GGDEF domain-containing protein